MTPMFPDDDTILVHADPDDDQDLDDPPDNQDG
jgi:hypothetical protein